MMESTGPATRPPGSYHGWTSHQLADDSFEGHSMPLLGGLKFPMLNRVKALVG